jgi:hypothetical protein
MFNIKKNKYSKKCLNIIKNNLVHNVENINYELIFYINNIYDNTLQNFSNHIIRQQKLLKKLHNKSDCPLIYLHYLEVNKDKSDLMSINKFYNYYTENNDKLENLLSEKSIVTEIIENPIKERIMLHNNIYGNYFVSIDIQQCSEIYDLNYTHLQINEHNIYIYEVNQKLNIELLSFIIQFMENLSLSINKKKYKSVNLTIFLCPQKKIITNTNFLGPENINSGSTYMNSKVFIWRADEIYKVLIHELIHYYGFDHELFKDSFDKLSQHCIIGEDRQNEAFTESFAIILHTFIISKFLNEDFNKLLQFEINFSIFQCKKIINFYDIKDIKEIISNKNCKNPINQKTSVFSYFINKTCMLLNLIRTMNFIYNYLITKKNINEDFNNLLNELLSDETLNIINISYNQFLNDFKKNKFVYKTMRMTCLEYN